MKVEEAITKLKAQGKCGMFEVEILYGSELCNRVSLRAHGNNIVSIPLFQSVLKEMDIWIVRVCRGLGWTEDASEKAKAECGLTAIHSMKLAIEARGIKTINKNKEV